MLMLFLACTPDPAPARAPVPSTSTPPPAPTSTTTSAPLPRVDADHLALPYASVGDPAPSADFVPDPPVLGAPAVLGPFIAVASGDGWKITCNAKMDVPGLYAGELGWADGDRVVTLAAVVGDPALPAATWTTDATGTSAVLGLPSAPFPSGDDSVLIVAPARFASLRAPGDGCGRSPARLHHLVCGRTASHEASQLGSCDLSPPCGPRRRL